MLTRSRDNGHLVGGDRGLALLADQRGVQLAAALGVLREARRARRPGQMVVTPVHEGEDRDEQLSAHRGKPVVKAVGVLLVADSLEHSGLDEPTKMRASYDFGFMDVVLHAWVKQGVLVIAIFNRFRDASGRSNYFDREFFYRAEAGADG